jgi:hypothetical protein
MSNDANLDYYPLIKFIAIENVFADICCHWSKIFVMMNVSDDICYKCLQICVMNVSTDICYHCSQNFEINASDDIWNHCPNSSLFERNLCTNTHQIWNHINNIRKI